jgi:menaquinone-dependent protoporphyrinogen oxidase
MKTTIFYASKYGFTKKCVDYFKQNLDGLVEVIDLKDAPDNLNQLIEQSDRVIIGGSVYVGLIQKEVKDFLTNYHHDFMIKELGLFMCGMREKEEINQEMTANFSEELRNHATFVSWLGGEFDFEKLSWLDKMIVKKIAKVNKTTTIFHQAELDQNIKSIERTNTHHETQGV